MNEAFGRPGERPTWTTGAKSGVGTAASPESLVWFTFSQGIMNEVYYPQVDTANIKDAQFVVAGDGFFSEEKSGTRHKMERLDLWAPAFRITNTCLSGRYEITKDVITDPSRNTLIQQVRFIPLEGKLADYSLFALTSPHIGNQGYHNDARIGEYRGNPMLLASSGSITLAVMCSSGFSKRSVGYAGTSGGWQDIAANYRMTNEFDSAPNGNVVLTGQIDLPEDGAFTLVFGFGKTEEEAAGQAYATIEAGYENCYTAYVDQWKKRTEPIRNLSACTGDDGALFRSSVQVLLSHQDKLHPGGTIASLSFPWGETSTADGQTGGYHLVWPRDLVQTATGHMAIDDVESARAILLYLAGIQQECGGWHQNNWIDGRPFWDGIQLDETAFPVILAWRLSERNALEGFDPWPMVFKAAAFLIRQGPVTGQERWEEDGGYSPSTLAAMITALICTADLADAQGEREHSVYLTEVADWWASNLDAWTYTTNSLLDPELPAHYERLNTVVVGNPDHDSLHQGKIPIRNLAPDVQSEFPVDDVVDAGFLQLVDYGIRPPHDPHILKSVQVVDKVIKVELPAGPSWYRYNHDGYGEHENGDPFQGYGVGQAWPLLTGERAHYELAAGNKAEAERLARALEDFAAGNKLLPEQLWTLPDIPDKGLHRGKPTGSAMPLVWAHAEYLNLLRSLQDDQLFDRVPIVAERYKDGPPALRNVWRFNHKVSSTNVGEPLRIEVLAQARIHWSMDNWHTVHDDEMRGSGFGTYWFDIPLSASDKLTGVEFTFYWTDSRTWENADFTIWIRHPLAENR